MDRTYSHVKQMIGSANAEVVDGWVPFVVPVLFYAGRDRQRDFFDDDHSAGSDTRGCDDKEGTARCCVRCTRAGAVHLSLSGLHAQDAYDAARVLTNTIERRGGPTGADDAAGDLTASHDAMAGATRALAKQMRFKQAWEVIKSMRSLGYVQRCTEPHLPLLIVHMTWHPWRAGRCRHRPGDDLIKFVLNGGKEESQEDGQTGRRQQNEGDAAAAVGGGAEMQAQAAA